jgi:hypothetical protein
MIFALLLFEPIIIDQQTYDQILAGAHANMRGTEYDMLTNMLNQLEQQAMKKAMQRPSSNEDHKDAEHK